jgi:ATP-binding cassette, subfamily B, bacterial HlyB/CyaB
VSEPRRDTGLERLSLLLPCHRVAIDPAQAWPRFGGAAIGVAEMLRCDKEFNFKAGLIAANGQPLARLSLPVIAERYGGGFPIVARLNALVQVGGRQRLLSRSEFQAFCGGRVALLTRRTSIRDLSWRPDISWFLRVVQKYRRLLPRPLALITPLSFLVVTDKVPVYGVTSSSLRCRSLRACRAPMQVRIRVRDKPHQCRARCSPASLPDGTADRGFRYAPRRRFSCSHLGTREHS